MMSYWGISIDVLVRFAKVHIVRIGDRVALPGYFMMTSPIALESAEIMIIV